MRTIIPRRCPIERIVELVVFRIESSFVSRSAVSRATPIAISSAVVRNRAAWREDEPRSQGLLECVDRLTIDLRLFSSAEESLLIPAAHQTQDWCSCALLAARVRAMRSDQFITCTG